MAASVNIQVSANAQGVYDEIVRQARRAEAVVKKIPLRIETKDLQGFKTLTADIDRFDKSVSRMSAVIVTFGQAAALIFGVQNAFAALIKTSISVEKKLNDINAIAQGSATSLQKLSDGLFNIAKQTGQSFDVAATAAQEFSRQGLSVSETLKRTRDALTLTRIAGLDAAKATQSLTAIFNTFNKEALDTTKITNTLANVDTKFAVSAADLTQALSRAGASAADAKVPFNELVAAVTSLQQTTARGGNVIGNSLKSIFTRLQRNDTVQALREIGVEVRDTEGNIRPLMTVLTELSKTFYTLGDAQKASIKEQVAGVYQINQLSALLADLSGGYSTYTNALNTANKTQNEAVDRLEILKNTTAGSLNDMMANLTQFAGDFGKVFTKPLVKNPIDILNSVFDFTKGFADSEDVGAKIGKGLIQGLGTFLGSGGTVLLSKSLFNIGRLVVEGVKDQLFAATTLNRTSEKHLQLQEQIKSVLLTQDSLVQSKIAAATNEAERQKIILSIIEDQTAAMIRLNSIAGKAATSALKSGWNPIDAVAKRAAGGYLPSMMAEKAAVNNGVGGANKNAKPVVIPNFNLGGGKREAIVANSSEYIIPNFAGGNGSAIFNQDMIKKYGLPSGAQKIMAGGHIPNITSSKIGSKAYASFLKKHGGSIEDIQSLFSNLFGGGRIPSTRIEDLKENPLFRNIFMGTKAKTFGFYNYDNNSISLNRNQKADEMLKTYSHEMGHAAEENLSRSQLDKVKKAFDRDVSVRGESIGETFLGSHAKSYPGAEFSESFAESVSKAFLKKKLGGGNALTDDSLGKKSLMYRYIRKEISNRMANGYVPNFAKFGFGKSPADIDRVGLRRISVKDSPSYLDYGLDKEKKSLFIKFIKSNEKGNAFEMFNRLVKIGKKTKVNQIYSDDLVAQGNRSTTSEIVNSNDAASSVFKLFPQLRYRDQKGLKTSGYLLGIDEKGIKFKSLDHLKKIVGSPQNEGPVKYALNNKSLSFFGLKTKIANGGHIPNFNPLLASLKREASSLQSLGYSKDQIFSGLKVQSSPILKNNDNPTGLGVFNTLQGQNSIGKALSDHRGENLQRAGIPNFATPRQALRDVLRNLRSIESGSLSVGAPGTLTSNPIGSIQDLSKNQQTFRATITRLTERFQKQIAQTDEILRIGNLDLQTETNLINQKKYLEAALKQSVSTMRKDPTLLRRERSSNVIATEYSKRLENIETYRKDKKTRQDLKKEEEELKSSKEDRLKSEKRQRFQSGLLLASFAVPFGTEIGSNLLGGEKTRGGRIASGIGGPLSAGLSLATFGGPLGVAAGIGVAGLGIGKSILGNKEVKGFSDRFTSKDQLQTALDSLNAQQETFGQFQDAFIKFTDAKGADKEIAGQNLSRVISTFADKKVGSELSGVAFGGGSLDEKLQKQIEIQQKANLSKQTEANIQAFKTLYDETITGSSLLSQWNDKVDIAPEKVNKFAKLLSDTVDITKVSGPIDNKFLNDLLKKSGTGIENQKDNIGVTRIVSELKYNLEQSKNAFDFTKGQAAKIEKSKFDIDKSKTGFSAILTQKDFINRLGIESFKTRLESPIFDAGTRKTLENQASRNEIAAGFEEGLNKIKGRFVDAVTGDKSNVSYTKQVSLLDDLLKSSESNNIEDVVKQLETANETFKEIKDKTELKDIYNSFKELLQNSANQLTQQKKIAEIQERNNNDQRLLTLFDKLGLAGGENKGRISGDAILKLGLKKEQIRTTGLLSPDIESKAARQNIAKIEEAKAFIDKAKIEKESLNGAAFSDKRKAELEQRLRESFTSVTKAGSIEDIRGSVGSIRSKFGNALNFETKDFEKVLQTGDAGAIVKAFPIFQKRSLSQLGNTNLDTKSNRGILKDLLSNTGGFVDNLSKVGEIANVKTLETLGGTNKDKDFVGTQFKGTLGVLQTATETFASSATELAKAILQEKNRNADLSTEFKKTDKENQINDLQRKINENNININRGKKDSIPEISNFLNLDSNKPGLKEFTKARYSLGFSSALGFGSDSYDKVNEEVLNRRRQQIEDFRKNPNSSSSLALGTENPKLVESLKRELEVKSLSESNKKLQDKLYFLRDNKNTSPIQQSSSNIQTPITPSASPSASSYSSPNVPQASAQTSQQSIEVNSNRNIKLDINGVISSASNDKELEDRMVASVLAKFTELMDKNLTAIGEKRLTFNSIG